MWSCRRPERPRPPDVVDRLAVTERASACRVVADHPADGGPVAGRDVRPEHQAHRLEVAVELIEHHARLDANRHASRSTMPIRFKYFEKSMTRPAPTVWPERLVAAPRGTIGTCSSAAIETAAVTSSAVLGTTTPMRFDLVEAGIRRVEAASSRVEIHLGAGFAAQTIGEMVQCGGGNRARLEDGIALTPHHGRLLKSGERAVESPVIDRRRPARSAIVDDAGKRVAGLIVSSPRRGLGRRSDGRPIVP